MINAPYSKFVIDSFFLEKGVLSLEYKVEGSFEYSFTERIDFKKDVEMTPDIHEACKAIHILAGVSYYKMFASEEISISHSLSKELLDITEGMYTYGLGEFYCQNNLPFPRSINISHEGILSSKIEKKNILNNRSLVGIGGGKDSLVTTMLLKRHNQEFSGFVVDSGETSQIKLNVIEKSEHGLVHVVRTLDPQVFDVNIGVYNGHIPITGIISAIGVATCLIYDYRNLIFSNESSSNFGNREYGGVEINHQWSKSFVFEKMFSKYIEASISDKLTCFSALRHLPEIAIAKKFTQCAQDFFTIFSSSNHNFKIHSDYSSKRWDSNSPKTHFVFLMLSAFLDKDKLIEIFGEYLFGRSDLVAEFEKLIGLHDQKPFECVGTFEESKASLVLGKAMHGNSLVAKTLLKQFNMSGSEAQEVLSRKSEHNIPEHMLLFFVDSVAILGYGVEGRTSETFITSQYSSIQCTVFDMERDGEDYLQKAEKECEIIIKTPGIPMEKISSNALYITATNIFFSKVTRQGNITIGVTGTRGKTSTSMLIAHILKCTGRTAVLVGNGGFPMLDQFNIGSDVIIVSELSSYQLSDCRYSPNIAVITNLFNDHVPYHGSIEAYHESKKNLLRFQKEGDTVVYNTDFVELEEKLLNKKQIYSFSKNTHTTWKSNLVGEHNQLNIEAAFLAVKSLGITEKEVSEALLTFQAPKYRLADMGIISGLRWYNDSASFNPESTIAALEALPDAQTLFLGGYDRGYDYTELLNTLSRSKIKNIILLPETGMALCNVLQKQNSDYVLKPFTNMFDAVSFAHENTEEGKTVLLSCGAPSYNLWKDYLERGKAFEEAVKSISGREESINEIK